MLTRLVAPFPRPLLISWALLAAVGLVSSRTLVRVARGSAHRHGLGIRRVAVAGYNKLGFRLAKQLELQADMGRFDFVGFFDDRGHDRLPPPESKLPRPQGFFDDLVAAARRREIDMILITLPMRAEARIQTLLDQLSDTTTSVYIIPDVFVFELLHSKWTSVGGLPAISLFETPFYGVDGTVKRLLDLVVATAALAVAALPMLIIAALVCATSPGPRFSSSDATGSMAAKIRILKFRTMRANDDGPIVKQATKDDPRITPLGGFLRKTSLDELPQLFNVLAGQHVARRPAPPPQRPQRAIPPPDPRLHAPPQGQARCHRPGPGLRLPRRNRDPRQNAHVASNSTTATSATGPSPSTSESSPKPSGSPGDNQKPTEPKPPDTSLLPPFP